MNILLKTSKKKKKKKNSTNEKKWGGLNDRVWLSKSRIEWASTVVSCCCCCYFCSLHGGKKKKKKKKIEVEFLISGLGFFCILGIAAVAAAVISCPTNLSESG
jgi:hypothetical protein